MRSQVQPTSDCSASAESASRNSVRMSSEQTRTTLSCNRRRGGRAPRLRPSDVRGRASIRLIPRLRPAAWSCWPGVSSRARRSLPTVRRAAGRADLPATDDGHNRSVSSSISGASGARKSRCAFGGRRPAPAGRAGSAPCCRAWPRTRRAPEAVSLEVVVEHCAIRSKSAFSPCAARGQGRSIGRSAHGAWSSCGSRRRGRDIEGRGSGRG